MDNEQLKANIERIKPLLKAATERLTTARVAHEEAYKTFKRLDRRYRQLEYQLSELDGRLKSVKTGRSGKAKKKGGEKSFNLEQYISTLSASDREKFLKDMLNE